MIRLIVEFQAVVLEVLKVIKHKDVFAVKHEKFVRTTLLKMIARTNHGRGWNTEQEAKRREGATNLCQ